MVACFAQTGTCALATKNPLAKLAAPFQDHPSSVGETYASHMVSAASFAARMWIGGIACLVHGLFPFLFKRRGSDAIRALHTAMVTDRDRVRGGRLMEAGAPESSPVRAGTGER